MIKLQQLRPEVIFFVTTSFLLLVSYKQPTGSGFKDGITQVKITDAFWGPKFETWRKITLNDVFDK